MRLDPIHHQHVIRLVGEPVEMDRKPFGRAADLDRLHAGADRTPDKRLGDPVRLDQVALSLGRPAAVAPHGRDHQRPGAHPLEMLRDRPDDHVDVGDSPAPGRDRHALGRPDLLGQPESP